MQISSRNSQEVWALNIVVSVLFLFVHCKFNFVLKIFYVNSKGMKMLLVFIFFVLFATAWASVWVGY